MTNKRSLISTTALSLGLLLASACSSLGTKSGQDLAKSGPTVIDTKLSASPVELDEKLRAVTPAEVYADVKDLDSGITSVKLKLAEVPVEIPMKKLAGSTYKGTFSANQLKKLGVNGQTMRYQASVVATNQDGETGMSDNFDISIKAPESAELKG